MVVFKKMNKNLINIITRASRKESVLISIESVKSQTYKNIHHIITYETEEMREYLTDVVDKKKTTLVKVLNNKQIPGLSYSYNHHDLYTKFLEPNWEFWDRKVHINGEGFDPKHKIDVVSNKYEQWFGFATDLSFTMRKEIHHFPYNQYLKIAERYLKEGWVVYLDDDDSFYGKNTLEKVSKALIEVGEDTLFLIKTIANYGVKPSKKMWLSMKVGHPLVLGAIGASNFIFHSKYVDYTAWDEWRGADYRTAKCLEEVIPKKAFLSTILVNVGNIDLKNDD